MPDDATSYWPADFAVNAPTPLAILRIQAGALSASTQALIEAEVVTAQTPQKVAHELQLVAPALDGERHTVLTVYHAADEPYPATVEAALFDQEAGHPDAETDRSAKASTVHEFRELVKRVLQSNQVRATVESLLARSQDVWASTLA